MIFKVEIKVRGYHLDGYQHVNNARYLEFMEEGRWDFAEKSNILNPLKEKKIGMVIANININYKAPIFVDEVIEIRTSMKELHSKKGILEQVIYKKTREKAVIASSAEVIFVMIDLVKGRAVEMDEEILNLFNNLIIKE